MVRPESFACGFLAERLGTIRTIVVTEIATVAAIAAAIVAPMGVLWVLLAPIGLALNGTSSALYAAAGDLAHKERQARTFGLFYTVTTAASARRSRRGRHAWRRDERDSQCSHRGGVGRERGAGCARPGLADAWGVGSRRVIRRPEVAAGAGSRYRGARESREQLLNLPASQGTGIALRSPATGLAAGPCTSTIDMTNSNHLTRLGCFVVRCS